MLHGRRFSKPPFASSTPCMKGPCRWAEDCRARQIGDMLSRTAQRKESRSAHALTCEPMRAHASCRSLVWMPSRAMARSMDVSASVATWCPRPRLPLWIMMHTWAGLEPLSGPATISRHLITNANRQCSHTALKCKGWQRCSPGSRWEIKGSPRLPGQCPSSVLLRHQTPCR